MDGQQYNVAIEGPWLVVESPSACHWLRLTDIVLLESPMETSKPTGWYDLYAGRVGIRGHHEDVALRRDAWEKLLVALGTTARPSYKTPEDRLKEYQP